MKIIYIAESIIPSQTANSIHVMKMCQAFASNGYEVVLAVPDRTDKNISTDDVYDFYGVKKCFRMIKLPFFGGKFGFFIFAFLSVMKARKERPQIVYTRFLYSAFLGLMIGLPTIYEIHSSFINKIDKLFFGLINKNKLKKIIVISKYLKNYFIEKYKISERKILVAPDGADSIPETIDSIEIGENNKLKVGYIGHLYKGRGIDIIAEIAKRCDWIEFHVIGGLPEDLNFWKKELSKQENVIFYGHIPHKDVYRYMLSVDALIAPYQKKVTVQGRGDTCQWMSPLKIFEYMATGKVILASDLPALREVLEHKKNSLLAAPDNVSMWISNLESIRENIQLRKELGKNAKNDFENNYTWKSRAANVLN